MEFEDDILDSELEFPEETQADQAELLEAIVSDGSVSMVDLYKGGYVGNAMAYPPDPDELPEFCDSGQKSILLFNIIIDLPFRGRGYGSRLLQEVIRTSRDAGYEKLVGYFRSGPSLYLIRSLGAREFVTELNWFDSGENYVYCELPLK